MEIEDPAAIRILVCGNCGVGKSTLVNEIFGVEVVRLNRALLLPDSAYTLDRHTAQSARQDVTM